MDNENSVIYGLEFQVPGPGAGAAARRNGKIRFLIGTQSLKQSTNQIHLVEFSEEDSTLKTTVFHHSEGEIWKLNTSPHDPLLFVTCYNAVSDESGI